MAISENNRFRTAPSKILVLGATGDTGRLIVKEALARGYDVSALVRSADKGRDLGDVKLVIGDARDEAVMRKAVSGQDAVVSALGTPASPFREVTLLVGNSQACRRDERRERCPPRGDHGGWRGE